MLLLDTQAYIHVAKTALGGVQADSARPFWVCHSAVSRIPNVNVLLNDTLPLIIIMLTGSPLLVPH